MKNIFMLLILVFSTVFINTAAFAEVGYSDEELQNAFLYLREHRDELGITGYGIDEENHLMQVDVYKDDLTEDKKALISEAINMDYIIFRLDYGVVKEYSFEKNIKVYTDEGKLQTDENISMNQDYFIFVSGKNILQSMGFEVTWDNDEKKLIGQGNFSTAEIKIGEDKILVTNRNGEKTSIELSGNAVLIDDKVYFPI